jgi:hypothetical protein
LGKHRKNIRWTTGEILGVLKRGGHVNLISSIPEALFMASLRG